MNVHIETSFLLSSQFEFIHPRNGYSFGTDKITNTELKKVPFRQQESAKKCCEGYLMFGPNHIAVTLRWDNGLFLWSRKCLPVVLR